MRLRTEPVGQVEWKSDLKDMPWHPNRKLDIGHKEFVKTNHDTDILLTEEDLHFYPTQKDLDTYTYFAPTEVYNKLFKPLYMKRTVNKDKVISSELMLKELK